MPRAPPISCWAPGGGLFESCRRTAPCTPPPETETRSGPPSAKLLSPLERGEDSWEVNLSQASGGGRSWSAGDRRSIISPHRTPTPEPERRGGRGKEAGFLGVYRPSSDEQADGASEETPEARATDYPEGEDASSGDSVEACDDDDCVCIKVAATPPPPPACPPPPPRRKPCLKKSSSLASLAESETEIEAFEECERTLKRAADARRVRFDPSRNVEAPIPALEDYGWRCRRDCYWQPEEYAQMARSRVRLERAVLETGGRVAIAGESRRGLGLVCEPETRLARASKIQQTARLVLRRHAEGATPGALARFAADASRWATRNALVCAEKDLQAAREALRDGADAVPSSPGLCSYLAPEPALEYIPRCDSNTASTDGLASMIRNDSLNDLANLNAGAPSSPAAVMYLNSATRHRIAPAAARVASPAA